MVSGNGAAAPVRPVAESRDEVFGRALCEALTPLEVMMSWRQRVEALAHARREIMAAFAESLKAERRRVVQMTTPPQLRNQILDLVDSHTQLLDLFDDLERVPVVAAEVKRLCSQGEIPWSL